MAPTTATTMMMDFESAERNAFATCFPNIRILGCTFHYGQALIRKIGQIGLKVQYSDKNSLVRAYVRHLLALPFLPTFLVPDAWNFYLRNPQNLVQVLGLANLDLHSLNLLNDFARYFAST